MVFWVLFVYCYVFFGGGDWKKTCPRFSCFVWNLWSVGSLNMALMFNLLIFHFPLLAQSSVISSRPTNIALEAHQDVPDLIYILWFVFWGLFVGRNIFFQVLAWNDFLNTFFQLFVSFPTWHQHIFFLFLFFLTKTTHLNYSYPRLTFAPFYRSNLPKYGETQLGFGAIF